MNWRAVGCTVQGRRHQAEGLACQDRVHIRRNGGFLAAALADGAGSAAHGGEGAAWAASRVCGLLEENFERFYASPEGGSVRRELTGRLRAGLKELADRLGVGLEEVASTLIFAAVKEDRFLLGHIGDGVFCRLKGGAVGMVSRPTRGEFANTTVFVASPEAERTMFLGKGAWTDLSGLCMMTDGTASSLYDRAAGRPSPVVGDLLRMCAAVPAGSLEPRLEESVRQSVLPATGDDCGLLLLAPEEPEGCAGLPDQLLSRLLGLPEGRGVGRRLARFRTLLSLLEHPCSLGRLAAAIHLRPKYTRRYLRTLMTAGLIRPVGCWFTRIV